MGATSEFDRQRIRLEHALGELATAEQLLRIVCMRLVQRARTMDEADLVEMVMEVRVKQGHVREALAGFHPNALDPPPPTEAVGCPSPVPSQG